MKTNRRDEYDHCSLRELNELLANREMHLISFAKSESDRQSRVNPDGCAVPHIEIPTAEIPSDSSSLFFGEVTRSFVWAEGRSRGPGESAVVIVVVLM